VVSRSPGLRRIFPSVLFLISSSFLLLEELGKKGAKGVCLASFLIGCVALFAVMRTNYAVRNTWGYPPYADVEQAVSELKTHLLEAEPFEQLIVAVNNERLRHITCCSLYLGLLGKNCFAHHSQTDLASLIAGGDRKDAREPLPLRDDFGRVRGRTLLVTNSTLNINRLQRHFEKPFKASLVLGTKARRKSSRKLYAYEFD